MLRDGMRTGYTPRIVVEITIGETMIRPHNIDWSAWDNAKHGAREAMIATARSAKGTMTYSELSKQITSLRLGPDSLALRELLGEISVA